MTMGACCARWCYVLQVCAHYSTSGGLVGGIRTLGVPVAESQVAEFDIAEALSERAVEAYTRDGRLRVVDEGECGCALGTRRAQH